LGALKILLLRLQRPNPCDVTRFGSGNHFFVDREQSNPRRLAVQVVVGVKDTLWNRTTAA
jgi:hypothetical protein